MKPTSLPVGSLFRVGHSTRILPWNTRVPRHQLTLHLHCRAMSRSSFTLPLDTTLPERGQGQGPQKHNQASVSVNLPPDLSKDELLQFPAFKIWLSTLQRSLAQQKQLTHEFHNSPYSLRRIDVQAVDHFGGGRVGFVKLKADIRNEQGESLPGSVFLRGGSVGMLLILQPDDIPPSSEQGSHAILTVQPRIPAGSLSFSEIPAGMIDDSGTFSGAAAKEIEEETGLSVSQDELLDMTALALAIQQDSSRKSSSTPQTDPEKDEERENRGEKLQQAMYPSPGGSDEFIPLFLCKKRMKRNDIDGLRGRLTGLRQHGEKITLKVVLLQDLWKEGARDGKTLAAWALYRGLKDEGRI